MGCGRRGSARTCCALSAPSRSPPAFPPCRLRGWSRRPCHRSGAAFQPSRFDVALAVGDIVGFVARSPVLPRSLLGAGADPSRRFSRSCWDFESGDSRASTNSARTRTRHAHGFSGFRSPMTMTKTKAPGRYPTKAGPLPVVRRCPDDHAAGRNVPCARRPGSVEQGDTILHRLPRVHEFQTFPRWSVPVASEHRFEVIDGVCNGPDNSVAGLHSAVSIGSGGRPSRTAPAPTSFGGRGVKQPGNSRRHPAFLEKPGKLGEGSRTMAPLSAPRRSPSTRLRFCITEVAAIGIVAHFVGEHFSSAVAR